MPVHGPSISLRGLSRHWGTVRAVNSLSLAIAAGFLVAPVGLSESGKSTLLKMINRLVEPTGGTIRIGDEAVDSVDPHILRRRIGYVFQNIGLFPRWPDRDDKFVAALNPLIGAITVENMRKANYMVDREADKKTPKQAARRLNHNLRE